MLSNNQVKVYVEKPDEKDCFHNVTCYLPEYKWVDINGFTDEEIKHYQEIIELNALRIISFAGVQS